jgi:hypothetical protein
MSSTINSYYSKSKTVNTEIILIPVSGSGNRTENTTLEVHNFEISASRMAETIIPDWIARIDIYIKSNNKIYSIFNNIVLKDGGRFYNEKTFNLLPDQSLCYKIKELTSVSTEPDNYNVKLSASTIEMDTATS